MILLMGGTKDSVIIGNGIKRELKDIDIIYTSTTDYGGELAKSFASKIITKPLDKEKLKKVILSNNIKILIDATHPFAINASKNAMEVCEKLNVKYIRYERKEEKIKNKNITYVKDFEEAFEIAKKFKKVFFMAGIKNLKRAVEVLGNKVVARVLPISVSEALNYLPQKNIVAMYGTFSKELNKYLILDYGCDAIITKESGETGGFKEKVLGALEANAYVIVVERPKLNYPNVFNNVDELINYLKENL
ncbi:precorrin-6A reductase [Methanocaldococcus indicus]|uniref:precorrin-6A reductase n=1 Tax=Methanocaldococcus indicus TaxID=213231 RepID=UPI003C6D8396